jgi:hypothetical protein
MRPVTPLPPSAPRRSTLPRASWPPASNMFSAHSLRIFVPRSIPFFTASDQVTYADAVRQQPKRREIAEQRLSLRRHVNSSHWSSILANETLARRTAGDHWAVWVCSPTHSTSNRCRTRSAVPLPRRYCALLPGLPCRSRFEAAAFHGTFASIMSYFDVGYFCDSCGPEYMIFTPT